MEKLMFSGLPESFRVGPATLRPVSEFGDLLQRCCVCDRVSMDSYLCASGHSYCPDCIPPSGAHRRWCVICAANVNFTTNRLPASFIEAMLFSCPCSFTATLSQIKEHLANTRSPEVCYRQVAAENGHRSSTAPQCCERSRVTLDSLVRDLQQVRLSLRIHESVIPKLTEGLSRMETICDALSADRQIFCFDFTKVLNREPSEQHKVVNGVPLKIQVCVVGLADEPYLCVSAAGSDMEVQNTTWPLKKCISLKILDIHGRPVVSYDVLTFEDGVYTHDSFMDPSLDPSSQGVSFFKALNEILHFYPKDDPKYMLLLASVKDI